MRHSFANKGRRGVSTLVVVAAGWAALCVGGGTAANAAVMFLDGGDTTDAFPWLAPTPASVVAAYDVGGSGGQVVQGITFTGWSIPAANNGATLNSPNNDITSTGFTAPFAYGSGLNMGASPNDTNLKSMLTNAGYSFENNKVGPITLTITGLMPGVQYRIDVFQFATSQRTQTFTFTDAGNGGAAQQTDSYLQDTAHVFLVQNTRTATAGGQIQLALTANSGGAPELEGIVVSFLPEPASLSLLGVGGLTLLRRRNAN